MAWLEWNREEKWNGYSWTERRTGHTGTENKWTGYLGTERRIGHNGMERLNVPVVVGEERLSVLVGMVGHRR